MGVAAGNISQILRLFCLLALLVIFGCHCGVTVNAQSSMPAVFISLNQVWSDFMNINCPGGLPRRALDFSLSHYFSSMNAVLNNSVIVTSP
jgi:energy-converting hydrogenase Eha subunit F